MSNREQIVYQLVKIYIAETIGLLLWMNS